MNKSLEQDDSLVVKQGRVDYYRFKGDYLGRNTYPSGSDEFNAYERGWFQSHKRDGGRLMALNQSVMPAPAPPVNPPQTQSSVNEYALAKGRVPQKL
jgi:hypothetical protein